jgi:hypothetical protein
VNTGELSRLADRADGVTGRQDERLAQVHSRIRLARRRRATGRSAAVGALVLALVVVTNALLTSPGPVPEPAPPKPDQVGPTPASVRELTWTDEWWPSRRIHYGDEVIDTRLDVTKHDFAQMDLTDDGVVVTTLDGRIWLADTSTVRQIGDSQVTHDFLAAFEVTTGDVGSLATWAEQPPRGPAHHVVYDTALRREVARVRSAPSHSKVVWVGRDVVYFEGRREGGKLRRLDIATGRMREASSSQYASDLLSGSRALVIGDTFDGGAAVAGRGVVFHRRGSHLLAARPDSNEGPLISVFDSTGAPVRLRVPGGYDGARSFTVFQWIDDDRLAMMAGAGSMGFVPGLDPDLPEDSDGYGDILVCRVSTGTCVLALPGPGDEDVTRIVPHYGTPGTN